MCIITLSISNTFIYIELGYQFLDNEEIFVTETNNVKYTPPAVLSDKVVIPSLPESKLGTSDEFEF